MEAVGDQDFAKILVVEDDKDQRMAITRLLSKLEANVFDAESGQKALSLMLRHDFVLVILDINMPNMDGIETARLMRANEPTANIPIIYVTAYSQDDQSISEAYQLGAIDYLFKPLKSEILLAKVQSFLFYHYKEQERQLERELQKEAEKEDMKRRAELLALQNKELREFSYITSHDLQNPLNTISNYVQILQEDYGGKLDKDAERYLNTIAKASERMQKLIKDLLVYSQIGQKRVLRPVDLNELIKYIQSDLHYLISETGANFEIGKLPQINGVDTEFNLLFQNLITNAIKFVEKGIKPQIKISAEEGETHWAFEVEDNGIGMEEKYQEKIFAIFQRLHSRKQYEGTGIGLAHCQKIVEYYEGRIWVDSILNEGSTFRFTIKK
ncbi:MAG: response regulator [Bacteroidia bacterium]